MSQITTHVLDTAKGIPANGIAIVLQSESEQNGWRDIASGVTNSDGRIADLLPEDKILEPGIYRMVFQTRNYFDRNGIPAFYPEVCVIFETTDPQHYHIPLLLSPFGYSTYRGS